MTVGKAEPVSGGEGAKRLACSMQPSRRKADCTTDSDADCGLMSKLRGRGGGSQGGCRTVVIWSC